MDARTFLILEKKKKTKASLPHHFFPKGMVFPTVLLRGRDV